MSDPSPQAVAGPPLALDRHALRRGAALPTLTVLVGPVGLAVATWRRWAASRRRATAHVVESAVEPAVSRWVAVAARTRDLAADALAFLAARAGRPLPEPQLLRAAKTPHDLEQFLEGVPPDRAGGSARTICRHILRQYLAGVAADPEALAGQLDAALGDCEGPWRRVVGALAEVIPADGLPGLLLAPAESSPSVVWVEAAARLLAGLVAVAPRLPAALVTPPDAVACYLRAAPESHARALVREGLVEVSGLGPEDIGGQLRAMNVVPDDLAEPIRRLADDGASEELVASFAEAACRLADPGAAADDDRARSAAERFLFERLESLPQTAGRFVLNAALDFRFGVKDAEVDLLAESLRLAIEVDGYHHFRDAEAYRRDRRKDWELQRRGYLVLRFLAEDVVTRMEEMLDRVLAAVEYGRHHTRQPRADRT